MKAKVIADSVAPNGVRLTTVQLKYQRFFHSEVMTHRVFTRNASSSRAIPVRTMLKQVWNEPAMPIHWGLNQSGMQARAQLKGFKLKLAKGLWKWAGRVMCGFAWGMMKVGLHKQVANRILEPWQWIHVVISSTDWDNFFALRDHPDAQPEIQALARLMKDAMALSTPKKLKLGEWHLPYVTEDEVAEIIYNGPLAKLSVARLARVSYNKHDGSKPSLEEDFNLHDRLTKADPPHLSPTEHVATPLVVASSTCGNFRGWQQYRRLVEEGRV